MKLRALSRSLSAAIAAATLLSFAPDARAQMSDTERKSAARAAYAEGVRLQDEGNAAEALGRFEAAQKFFDAPTHLLHIAECQAAIGRLVEATETYELLNRRQLPPGSPEAFVLAQQQGQAELPPLRARVPTLRITVKPEVGKLQGLQVTVNGVAMPVELVGIARPLNPGVYRFTAQAQGYATAAAVDVPLAEKERKDFELTLVPSRGGTVAPAPPPYTDATTPPAEASAGPTSFGLLFGARFGASIPAGSIRSAGGERRAMSDETAAGGGAGIDVYARLAKMLLIGGTFEYMSLSAPSTLATITGQGTTSGSTTYFGAAVGIVPNIDKVSFIGDVGIGSRSYARELRAEGLVTDVSYRGIEFGVNAGLSIPAGPIRIVPRVGATFGSFTSFETGGRRVEIGSADRETHAFVFLGLGVYYSLGFGPKPAAPATTPAPASL